MEKVKVSADLDYVDFRVEVYRIVDKAIELSLETADIHSEIEDLVDELYNKFLGEEDE